MGRNFNRTGDGRDGGPTRRGFLGLAAWGLAAPFAAAACRGTGAVGGDGMTTWGGAAGDDKSAREGRLLARPSRKAEKAGRDARSKDAAQDALSRERAARDAPKAGAQRLGLDAARDAWLYVPAGYTPGRPARLAVMLHGAGGRAEYTLSLLRPLADESNLILLAPQSRAATWDVIRGGYGPDVSFIDRALAEVFARYAVDASCLAVGGFSDGASYALSLGITNGDLFTHVLAYSPGFAKPGDARGRARFYVSHGTRDKVLPVELCSRRLVPQLKEAGYKVLYREFDGPHDVPAEIVRESVGWLVKK